MKRSLLFCLAASLAIGLHGHASAAAAAQPYDDYEQIHLRSGQLPKVNLTAELLYRILASEIAAQRGEFTAAGQGFFELARDTSDPRLAKKAFQLAVMSRDMDSALQAAQQWVLLAPTDPEAVAASLALSASNGETAGLASALWERIEKAEDKETAVAQAAAIVSKMNDKQVAFDVLEKALREPVHRLPITRMALADAAWAAGNAERALAEAQKALALEPDSEPAAQRALEYGMKVDPDAAIRDARVFIRDHPDAAKVQLLLANHLVVRGDHGGALQIVDAMRERNPEDFDLLYTEAEINYRAQQYDQASKLLHQYIAVQTQRRQAMPDNATNAVADASDARLLLVRIAEKQGQLDEAIEQLRLIDDPAVTFQARIHMAVLQGRQGNLRQALETINAIKPRHKQESAVIALTKASIYREAGRTEQALQVLIQADKALPSTPEIKYDLGMLYETQGRFDEFERLMLEVIDLAPDNANAYNALGYTFADQNIRLEEAQELLDRALELEPDSPFILDSVGWYLYRTGDYEAALEFLERSYELMPLADVAAHLGEVLWTVGRRTEALRIWREALAKEPDNPTLVRTLERFGVRP